MIFISHNVKDKAIVEPIAIRLKKIYGQENVFYDSWSIQPGDGIIDKMNEGLSKCKYFLFFVSRNSLKSQMVKMEWQNALMKEAKHEIKFITILMDDTQIPDIMAQKLYINLSIVDSETAFRQIVDVLNGKNTYRESSEKFSNLVAYKHWEGDTLVIECRAEYYLESRSSFIFCTDDDINKISACLRNETIFESNEMLNIRLSNGKLTNGIYRGISKGTSIGFPFVVEFKSKMNEPFDIKFVMHEEKRGKFKSIPMEAEAKAENVDSIKKG